MHEYNFLYRVELKKKKKDRRIKREIEEVKKFFFKKRRGEGKRFLFGNGDVRNRENKSDQAGTRAILFSTGIPASAIYLNNRRILYIFTDRTSCRGYARGGKRGKKMNHLVR